MNTNFKKNLAKGFSLVELIVVVSIIIIITTIALWNQAKFSSDMLITNMAYEVALTIRQMEVYGTSSKGGADPSLLATEKYRVGYGVHFEDSGGSRPGSFTTFIDLPDSSVLPNAGEDTVFDYAYSAGSVADVTLDTIDLTQGQKIHRFCAHNSDDDEWDCFGSAGDFSEMSLDIVFVKPNPDAHITVFKEGAFFGNCLVETGLTNCGNNFTRYDQAKIVIVSGLGDKCRTVTVSASGQISIDPVDSSIPNGGCDEDYNNP